MSGLMIIKANKEFTEWAHKQPYVTIAMFEDFMKMPINIPDEPPQNIKARITILLAVLVLVLLLGLLLPAGAAGGSYPQPYGAGKARPYRIGTGAAEYPRGSLNDLSKTPGDVRTTDKVSICTTSTKTLRKVSSATHKMAFKLYGITNKTGWCNHTGTPVGCEVDHLISLELGGTNDIKNLWPQPYGGIKWNAKVKDKLENRLHKLICDGTITPAVAQHAISHDWIAAYQKYMK